MNNPGPHSLATTDLQNRVGSPVAEVFQALHCHRNDVMNPAQCRSNPLGGVIIVPLEEPRGPQTELGCCGSLEAHPTGRFGPSIQNQESIQCPPVLTCPNSA
jgi:hypothetical protein